MKHPEYSSVNPENGNVTYKGELSIEKGDHSHMPARTESYLPGDERGHVNASSLNGSNDPSNVVPQHHDVNQYGYREIERGETAALQNGAQIYSEKTAIVDGQPGDRPHTFTVNDTVTYADGHTEHISHSFVNASYEEQEAWAASLPDPEDMPNPGCPQETMSAEEYAELMEATDAELPSLADEYEPSDHSGLPGADTSADSEASSDPAADAASDAADADCDASADGDD